MKRNRFRAQEAFRRCRAIAEVVSVESDTMPPAKASKTTIPESAPGLRKQLTPTEQNEVLLFVAKLKEHYGNPILSRKLGFSLSAVSHWGRDRIPGREALLAARKLASATLAPEQFETVLQKASSGDFFRGLPINTRGRQWS